jgi:hypothetical protein
VTEEQRSPEEIRKGRRGDPRAAWRTAAAVAQKTDVKQQAKAKVSRVKEKASAKADSVKQAATAKRRGARRRPPTSPGPRSSAPSGSPVRTRLRLRSAGPSLPDLP